MESDFNYRQCTGYNIVCNDSYVHDDMPFLIWKNTIYVRKELYEELRKLPKKESEFP